MAKLMDWFGAKQSFRPLLLRNVLTILLISLSLLTFWSGYTGWHGGEAGARTWLIALCGLVSWSIAVFATRLIRPLSDATEKLDEISTSLSSRLQLSPIADIDTSYGTVVEIGELQRSVEILQQVVAKMDAMETELNNERAKNFASAKLVSLGEMASGIAHEINSPLAAIVTRAGQLQELVADDEIDQTLVAEIASEIEGTSHRIAKIITGLRAFSRDASMDPFTSTSVRSIVEGTIAFCSEKFLHGDVRLEVVEIPPHLFVDCRPSQISQVLLNLLSNAFDAVEKLPERWVRIEVVERGASVDLEVTDSGDGIAPAVRAKLFQPFFTTKDIGKGTGLGLGIARKIAESHGGMLDLDSQSLKTKFQLSLPVRQAANEREVA